MSNNNLALVMKERAKRVQAVTVTVHHMNDVLRYTIDLTLQENGTTIAAPGLDVVNLQKLEDLCHASGLQLLHPPFRSHSSGIHMALTGADRAIAETGTLVLDSSSEDIRIATMLSETHIAWIPASRIMPDASALSAYMQEKMASPPGYMAFITGPSRTADIERVLAIGVHGPQRLHILIMEDSPS